MENNLISRDYAREYFEKLNLSYYKIKEIDIRKLSNMIETELINFYDSYEESKIMNMKIANIRNDDIKLNKKFKKLRYAKIQVNGSYFKRREAITFNETGFIGFGGELDNRTIQPIIKAFLKWCDTL